MDGLSSLLKEDMEKLTKDKDIVMGVKVVKGQGMSTMAINTQKLMQKEVKRFLQKEVLLKKRDLPKYLSKDQILDRLSIISPGKERMILSTLWMTGIRVTELISIRKCDVDFINHEASIRWLKNRVWNKRVIPLKKEICQLLSLYASAKKYDDLIFPYTRQWMYSIVKKYMGCSPHQLRHSFAVHFLRSSQNPMALVILQRLLGHKTIKTTMEYLKIVPHDLAIELEKVSFN